MIFFNGSKKKKKKSKKKEREKLFRRRHIIIEAMKVHEKNRKKAEETLAKGGWGETQSLEEADIGYRVASNVIKTIEMSGNAIEKLKKRSKSLGKSKKTHLAKLKKAKAKMQSRSRS